MQRPSRRLGLVARLLPDVRSEERARAAFFTALAAGIQAAQTVGLAGSEALLLARLGAQVLPLLFVVASAATVVATLGYAAVVGATRNDRLLAVLLGLGAAAVAAGFAVLRAGVEWAPALLFCTWFAAQAVLLNHFLTFAGDYFDTLASKRLIPLFAVGGSVGGALGGAVAAFGAGFAPPAVLVLAWSALLLAAGAFVLGFGGFLSRWRSLGFEEADETSVQNLGAALRHARTSPLGRGLVASVLAMIVALMLAQYLYSRVLAESFPSAEALAGFLGVLLLVSNLVEIGVEALFAPWLIRRFGVATANLVHAALTLASFGGLAVQFALPAAVAARLNREMLDNALAQPVRNLVYNALPLRLRGRMRALLEGILLYSGMSLAGALLLVAGEVDPLWICALGGAASLLYLAANWRVRRDYLGALAEQIREGRLDLADLGGGLGGADVARLGRLFTELLRADSLSTAAAAELAPRLAAHGVIAPLVEAASHPNASLRIACVRTLAGVDAPEAREAVRRAVDDPEPEIRLVALRAGRGVGSAERERRLEDPDPRVRALAAAGLGRRGEATLRTMLADREPAPVVAALEALPRPLRHEAAVRLDDARPAVRAAALRRLGKLADPRLLPASRLEEALRDVAPEVRESALAVAESLPMVSLAAVAERLDDAVRAVRVRAAAHLAGRGEAGVRAAVPYLRGGPWTADAAMSVLGTAATRSAREALRHELRKRVVSAWRDLLCLHVLARSGDGDTLYLQVAFGDALLRDIRLAFRTLRWIEGRETVGNVERALQAGAARHRADALELLSHLGDREAAGRLALLLEPSPLEDRVGASDVRGPADAAEVLESARRSGDPWVRMALRIRESRDPEPTRTMERLLALKAIPLFARLSLDQLETINRAMDEREFARGEVIFREGDPGDKLYLLLRGEVGIYRGYDGPSPIELNRMRAGVYLGEMGVLAHEPRSATAVALEDTLVSVLEGDRMHQLVTQMPEMSFEIFKVLVDRVRAAEDRLRHPDTEAAG